MSKERNEALKNMSMEELEADFQETLAYYNKISFESHTKGLESPIILRKVRRDVARVKTELRRREIAEMDETQIANRSKIRKRRRNNR